MLSLTNILIKLCFLACSSKP